MLQQAGTEFSYGDYEGYDTYKEEAGKKLDEAQNCGENADEYESRARYYYERQSSDTSRIQSGGCYRYSQRGMCSAELPQRTKAIHARIVGCLC